MPVRKALKIWRLTETQTYGPFGTGLNPTLTSASTDLFHREKKDSEILCVEEGGRGVSIDGGGAPPRFPNVNKLL